MWRRVGLRLKGHQETNGFVKILTNYSRPLMLNILPTYDRNNYRRACAQRYVYTCASNV